MSQSTPILALPLIQDAQAQKHVTHNEALAALDALVQPVAADRHRTAPPPSPSEGDRHLVAAGADGAWAGQDGALASFAQGGWTFHAPRAGWRAYVLADAADAVFDGAAWQLATTGGGDGPAGPAGPADMLGVNTQADAVNRLAVSAGATLLTHDGAGHQVKINKATPGDTASLLFQTGWSGRAEMGCAGGDDFAVKVSADGATFREALRIDRASGRVRFPSGTAGTGSAAGIMGGQSIVVVGEKQNGMSPGQFVAMGNGSQNTAGPAMPFACRIVGATVSAARGSAGVTSVAVAVNRVAQPAFQVSVSYPGTGVASGVASFAAAPLAVAAGDALTMVCTASTGGSDFVTTLFVVFD